eukprot:16276402-Heterocapsa_arctica.AAC.1
MHACKQNKYISSKTLDRGEPQSPIAVRLRKLTEITQKTKGIQQLVKGTRMYNTAVSTKGNKKERVRAAP